MYNTAECSCDISSDDSVSVISTVNNTTEVKDKSAGDGVYKTAFICTALVLIAICIAACVAIISSNITKRGIKEKELKIQREKYCLNLLTDKDSKVTSITVTENGKVTRAYKKSNEADK